MNRIIVTFFGVGNMRPAPGTWGSLAALPAAWIWIVVVGPWAFVITIPALYWLGLNATRSETAGKIDHDPSEIVIDEVVGQWIALLPVVVGASASGSGLLALWPGWIAAFVFFRIFDITKPWHIGRIDQRTDAVGVMLDDVVAGLYAAAAVVLLSIIGHFFL